MPEVGIREGEKLHEVMVSKEDAPYTYEYEKNYIIFPNYSWWADYKIIPGGKPVDPEFVYSSGTNTQWLSIDDLKKRLAEIYSDML